MYKLNYYCYYYYIVCMLTSVWESAQNSNNYILTRATHKQSLKDVIRYGKGQPEAEVSR